MLVHGLVSTRQKTTAVEEILPNQFTVYFRAGVTGPRFLFTNAFPMVLSDIFYPVKSEGSREGLRTLLSQTWKLPFQGIVHVYLSIWVNLNMAEGSFNCKQIGLNIC